MLEQFGAGSEFGPVVTQAQRRRLLTGIFENYYADTEAQVVFDTNRLWCARMPAVLDLFPEAKVIACVRNVAWVMDSIERLYRANPFETTKLFNDPIERDTVFSRVETLAQRSRLVGFPWTALKEAFYGAQASSLLVVDYDLLSQAPEKVMRLVYDFIGEAWFDHDFQQVEYDAPEFDAALGLAGLHKIRPKVGREARSTILPPDLFEQYSKLSFWHDNTHSAAQVIRVVDKPPSSPSDG